jgi:hypothetical protein
MPDSHSRESLQEVFACMQREDLRLRLANNMLVLLTKL